MRIMPLVYQVLLKHGPMTKGALICHVAVQIDEGHAWREREKVNEWMRKYRGYEKRKMQKPLEIKVWSGQKRIASFAINAALKVGSLTIENGLVIRGVRILHARGLNA